MSAENLDAERRSPGILDLLPFRNLTNDAQGVGDASPFRDPSVERLVFEQLVRCCYRHTGRHAILVAERGVGCVPLLSELARRGVEGRHAVLAERSIHYLDVRPIPHEESAAVSQALCAEFAEHPDWVVAIEGFVKLLGPGGRNSERFLGMLPQLRCNIIGLMSPAEYQESVSSNPYFREHFTPILVREPDLPLAISLLGNYARGLERQYDVTIEDEVVRKAAVLSANYVFGECLPGKAIKLLQRAFEDLCYERGEHGATRNGLTVDDVFRVVSEASGVPENTLRGIADKSDYEKSLSESIYGQTVSVR